MEELCSICKRSVDSDEAAILTMSGFGTARYMCDECASDFETATRACDIEQISAAFDRIGKKLVKIDADDKLTLNAVSDIMKDASARAEAIKNGSYDFSEEKEDGADEEIPEELRETEEDRELDRKEAEKNKKIDEVMNWFCIGGIIAAFGFLAYKLITFFF